MVYRLLNIFSVLVFVGLSGCATKVQPYEEKSVNHFYNQGLEFLRSRDYAEAAKQFTELERQHPYSLWAARGQVLMAYAYYENQNYASAVESIQSFLQLYPGHEDAPYMHYLLGMAYYEQVPIVPRDQDLTRKALTSFQGLITQHADTMYARDATFKLELLRDHLAAAELDVARFYLNKSAYIASIRGLQRVIRNHSKTRHAEEALHRLVECYVALGMTNDAVRTAAILQHNYPKSPWYADSYYLLKGIDLRTKEHKGEGKSWFASVFTSAPTKSSKGHQS
ncbi:MAG: outer membrane protein assembly factor BamD [Alphaproteobacteria bacterium]|nr:MAG: outer membrane protein assembly factor BamD [Alphaproteobacteria bacterium]